MSRAISYKNNPKLVDDDLRAHLATKPTVDICTACKNAVQSSKDFWTNSLVRYSQRHRDGDDLVRVLLFF